ncbi:uncharacterized protein LOC127095685 [Lathyrus oleraceus]|uniref:uncharacterized protein LOC127095685 n=1 Tax=Pisum sativum TaxID=3888 RepID=UPI0021D10BEE|nr:uncharacterized protein LOC127095685 [Pisum sativum]
MDRKRKNPNDFFSHVPFEASGDSEADSDPNMDCEKAKSSLCDDDNDDALSCCGGSAVDELINVEHECDDDDGEDNEKRKDEEEEKDVVYGKSYCAEDDDDDEVHGRWFRKKKGCLSFDLGGDSVDENEKNRRFWEACMAS